MSHNGPRRHFYDSIPAQTLIALLFNIISLFAGGLISIFTPQFRAASWILALFPPILTIRGGIGGIFSGNMATMLHLGLIRPKIRGNTENYWQLISSVFVITLIDTLAMGVFAFILNLVFGRTSIGQLYIFTMVPPVACTMAMALSLPLTSVIAIVTFRRGLDPDILVYPILASINDIVVTTAYAATIFLVLSGGPFNVILTGMFLATIGISCILVLRNRRVRFFYQIIREGTTVVIMSSLFGSLNGYFLSGLSGALLEYPGVMVLYPALTNALGNIGSIIGSTKTTSLALGYVRGFKEEISSSVRYILQVELVAVFMHLVFGLVTYMIVAPTVSGVSLATLVGVALISNLSSFLFIAIFAIVAAQLAFRRGLNPDNLVIPVITSISDTVATLTLLPSLMVLGFLGVI
ncbi:MAG: magnesium transporter [Candidatus Bathyarchaeota archaeon]|nr:MAG: magnesium transporter [Candidatus Bathyarchaeota archaeon]